MLTVDEIRKAMEAEGLLRKGGGEEMGVVGVHRKEPREIPEVINSRWVWIARAGELIKALREKGGVKDDLSATSLSDLRKMAKVLVVPKRAAKAHTQSPPKKPRRGSKKLNPSPVKRPDPTGRTRLVVAETLSCPSCGANLMIQGG